MTTENFDFYVTACGGRMRIDEKSLLRILQVMPEETLPLDFQLALARHPSATVRLLAAEKCSDTAVIRILAKDNDPGVLEGLSSDAFRSLSIDALLRLAQASPEAARRLAWAVGNIPNSSRVIVALAQHPDHRVRLALSQQCGGLPKVRRLLAKDPCEAVRNAYLDEQRFSRDIDQGDNDADDDDGE